VIIMKRRDFLSVSAGVGLALSASSRSLAADGKAAKQLLELRTYHFVDAAKQRRFDEFLAQAAVPAWNRLGVEPVGVFQLLKDDNPELKLEADSTDLLVLLPHKSAESVATASQRLAADEVYGKAGAGILVVGKADPAFVRYESSLLLAFDGVPQVEVPTKSPTRVAQLRIYESHTEERAQQKIAMFNRGGEIAIFRRVGMHPVFFGQSLIGSKLPNLTYMLAFDDPAAQKKAWDAFRADSAWLKLKDDGAYKDTVSTITNLVLRPTAASQI
jgi:NIPSNAP